MRQLPCLHDVALAWDQPILDAIAESLSGIATLTSLHLVFYDTLVLGLRGRHLSQPRLHKFAVEWYPRDAKYVGV